MGTDISRITRKFEQARLVRHRTEGAITNVPVTLVALYLEHVRSCPIDRDSDRRYDRTDKAEASHFDLSTLVHVIYSHKGEVTNLKSTEIYFTSRLFAREGWWIFLEILLFENTCVLVTRWLFLVGIETAVLSGGKKICWKFQVFSFLVAYLVMIWF